MRLRACHERLLDAARRARFAISFYHHHGELGLPVLHRPGDAGAPRIYISSGMHGDEPAGPLAVLELLRRRVFPAGWDVSILPLLNPGGLEHGTRTDTSGRDLNRDYGPTPQSPEVQAHQRWLGNQRFDLCLCLHEDYEGQGFYLYEVTRTSGFAPQILAAVDPVLPIDLRPEIDGLPAAGGVMQPPLDRLHRERTDLPESLHLWFHHTDQSLTFETPSARPITQRIAAHVRAVEAACQALTASSHSRRRAQESNSHG